MSGEIPLPQPETGNSDNGNVYSPSIGEELPEGNLSLLAGKNYVREEGIPSNLLYEDVVWEMSRGLQEVFERRDSEGRDPPVAPDDVEKLIKEVASKRLRRRKRRK